MAKFIKSIFTPEKRRNIYDDELEGEGETPPLDERRKLSMSRSGRLKQSYKRRQQLSVEVYGGEVLTNHFKITGINPLQISLINKIR